MAETAGLALGAISVATLFNNAIECFQLVRAGQEYERDVRTYQIRLSLLQLRLSQWGEVIGLDSVNDDNKLPFSQHSLQMAHNTLNQIAKLFNDIHKKREGDPHQASEAETDTQMRKICDKMRDMSIHRKNKAAKTTLLDKTKWAIAGKEEFEHLVTLISDLVDQLIAAFPTGSTTSAHHQLCQKDAEELCKVDKDAFKVLSEAMDKRNEQLRDALAKAVGSVVHTNNNTFSGANNQGSNMGQNYGTLHMRFGGI